MTPQEQLTQLEHEDADVFAHLPCVRCKAFGSLVLFYRLEARPLGTWSLAGAQLKTTASPWPYVRCDVARGGCGAECRGKRASGW